MRTRKKQTVETLINEEALLRCLVPILCIEERW